MSSAPAVGARQRVLRPEQIEAVFDVFRGIEPEPRGELDYVNAYTLLVAVALSAQATDVSVNAATKAVFEQVTTPAQMLALGEERLKGFIKTIGLYNAKAANVIKAAQILVNEHGGEVPEDRAALEALPGVGRKTANVVLQMYWGHPTIAVDTHVFRVSNRMGLVLLQGHDTRALKHPLTATVDRRTAECGALGPWPLRGLRPSHAQLNRYTGFARRDFSCCCYPKTALTGPSTGSG